MYLAYVSVKNYRGIHHLELTLGQPTTALIGENAYGKTNLLDALLVCLGVGATKGAFAFLASDFRAADGLKPIEILLGFRESSESEWDADNDCALVRKGIHKGPRGERRLELRVVASLAAGAKEGAERAIAVQTELIDREGKVLAAGGLDVVQLLRGRVPVIVLKADRYYTTPSRVQQPPTHVPIDLDSRLQAEIAHAYRELNTLHEAASAEHMQRGIDAAIAYAKRYGEQAHSRMKTFLKPTTNASTAERSTALLLVIGGLLASHGGSAFGEKSQPIIAIEDPEAHLHPTVLSAVKEVVRAIQAQKIVTTNSGELLAMLPLSSIRRFVRSDEGTLTFRLGRNTLADDEARRISYHVKANRGTSLFARCWLLVEGETEFWLMPELAEVLGFDFALEGVRLMEYAQCGVEPLVRFADDLGIVWHLMSDGDASGRTYLARASSLLEGRDPDRHLTAIAERDVEHCLWHAGYADVYRAAISGGTLPLHRQRIDNPRPTIERAIRAKSKPGLALAVAERAHEGGTVPEALRHAIEASVALARASVR